MNDPWRLITIDGWLGEQTTERIRRHMGLSRWVCPECVQGKHSNCDGTAWDFELDQLTACGCSCREEAIVNG